MEGKDFSWRWVTVDGLISTGPCDLLYCQVVTSDDSNDTYLYAGESASAPLIRRFQTVSEYVVDTLAPPVPIFCDRGLYADVGSNFLGMLVVWKELGKR